MNRIEHKFAELKRKKKKAFIVFITAGYPSMAMTKSLIYELSRQGADIIELGVPFSDPIADGPIIQEASQSALKKKVNISTILDLVKEIRRDLDTPIVLMSYYNPILRFGEEKFIRQASSKGVDGVIIPDLPPEEAHPFIALARRHNLDTIFFLAPTSSLKRIKFISGASRGFIYYVSLTGVTGPKKKLPTDLANKIRLIKRHTNKPICVGFGISLATQIKEIYKIADGVIVGSAVIKKIRDNLKNKDLISQIGKLINALKNV